ncbi:hypothetical protein LTS12_026895 [Elasticomyces elasticus]|nr:hypothetical protein LTS12_026895 [Elasticomyces elasticus]
MKSDWYPGNDRCDIVTTDIYASKGDRSAQASSYDALSSLSGGQRVIALAEVGDIPDPEEQASSNAPWAYWMTWSGEYISGNSYNTKEVISTIYNDARVVTLDGSNPWGGTGEPNTTTAVSQASNSTAALSQQQSNPPANISVVTGSSSVNLSEVGDSTTCSAVQMSRAVGPVNGSVELPTSSNSSSLAIKYLISFGDSYSQTGFDPKGETPSSSNPLGNPGFPGYTTSGGANWIGDYVTTNGDDPVLSYNFASGGATTDADLVQPFASTVLSLVDQVELYKSSMQTISPWSSSNSLFAIWIGVNDVGNAWASSSWPTLLSQIMSQRTKQAQTLYDSGARNFAFLTVPPINYTPLVIGEGSSNADRVATAITEYNEALRNIVEAFTSSYSDVHTYILDTDAPFMEAINNPMAYQASDATCSDSSGTKCLWWNNYHPGQAIHKLVAHAFRSLINT